MSYAQTNEPQGKMIIAEPLPTFQQRVEEILQYRLSQEKGGIRAGSTNRNTIQTMLLRRMSGKSNGTSIRQ